MVKEVVDDGASLDRVFRALSDPTRRAIVERLVRGPATVSDLAEPFAMSLSAVLQHLQVLIDADLAVTEKTGRVRTCRIRPDTLRRAEGWLAGRRTDWEHLLDRLGDVVTEHPDPDPDPAGGTP